MANWRSHTAAVSLGLLVAACASAHETRPVRTATEQLLVSDAAEQAARQFSLSIPADCRVHVEPMGFRGEAAEAAVSALREAILARGARLSPDRESADVIVEVRLGALSLDQTNRVVGVPSLTVPISTTLNTARIPELSLYSRADRTGVAEFSAFAYEAATGRPVALAGRFTGVSRITSHKLFMIFSWGQQEARPVREGSRLRAPSFRWR